MKVKNEINEMQMTCQYLRKEMLQGFEDLKKLKESGNITDADLDYELAKDRKAGLALKSIMTELTVEKMDKRKINYIEEK